MAQMDTRLPLLGQAPNPLGSFVQGVSARAQVDDTRRQQAEQQFLSQNGTALYQGDQNAMAEYANYNPQAAMEIRGYQESREQARQAAQRAASGAAARLSAAEAQAESDKLGEVLAAVALADTPEQYSDVLVGRGLDPEQYTWEDRFINLAMVEGAKEALDIRAAATPEAPEFSGNVPAGMMFADPSNPRAGVIPMPGAPGAAPADEYGRYTAEEAAAGRTPLSRIDYATAKRGEGITMTTPDGAVLQVGGPPRVGETDKPPKGWVRELNEETGDTRLVPEKGGPVWNEMIDQSQKAGLALESFNESTDVFLDEVDRALAMIEEGAFPTTGMASLISAVPGTPAFALASSLTTIKGNIGFDKLQDMRANSPTGGALGNVSDNENKTLQSTSGSLEQGNTAADLAYTLRRVREARVRASQRIEAAYNADFQQVGVTFGADIAAPTISEIKSMTRDELMAVTELDMDAMSTEELTTFIEASRAAAEGK